MKLYMNKNAHPSFCRAYNIRWQYYTDIETYIYDMAKQKPITEQ